MDCTRISSLLLWVCFFCAFTTNVLGADQEGQVAAAPALEDEGAVDAVLADQGGIDAEPARTFLAVPCTPNPNCPIDASNECGWSAIQQAFLLGACDGLPDPVDARLCRMAGGPVLLDGAALPKLLGAECVARDRPPAGFVPSAFAAGRALGLIDRLENTCPAGDFGDEDAPRRTGGCDPLSKDPSGFNVACSLVWFAPDDDPTDGMDTSFLYIGWDLSEYDGSESDALCPLGPAAPIPFDGDDDGSACRLDCIAGNEEPVEDETEGEFYRVLIQACADLRNLDPAASDSLGITSDRDLALIKRGSELFGEPLRFLSNPPYPSGRIDAFPATEGISQYNDCIDKEFAACAGVSVGGVGDFNNVEVLLKGVETSGVFGPHAVALPDSPEARDNRFALAQLAARLGADTDGDPGVGSEENAWGAYYTSVPAIEVSKRVRCVEDDPPPFGSSVSALPDSVVEFEIVVRNTGNEDLAVTLEDVLTEVGSLGVQVDCEVDCTYFEARLDSPRRGLVGFPVNSANAEAPPICAGTGARECLEPSFFDASCEPPIVFTRDSFLEMVAKDEVTSAFMGTLLGAQVTRTDGVCDVTDGDTLTFTFRSACHVEEGFCATFVDVDARNSVSARALIVPLPSLPPTQACDKNSNCDDGLFCNGTEVCVNSVCQPGNPPCSVEAGCNETTDTCGGLEVVDLAGVGDTEEELRPGGTGDDNIVDINLLCRDIDFAKQVRLLPAGPLADRLNIPSSTTFPAVVEYTYSVTNAGELDEILVLHDDQLCSDVAADGDGVTFVDGACALCSTNAFEFTVPAGEPHVETCQVRFATLDDLRSFLARDDGRPECNAAPGSVGDPDCYANCATVEADVIVPPGVCDGGPTLTDADDATICNNPCDLDVVKEVRCLPNCDPVLDANEPWLPEDSVLDVRASACVQYRIVATNVSDNEVPICELLYDDLMSCPGNFARGPYDVRVEATSNGVSDDLTCAPPFATAFNWLGDAVRCVLVEPAAPTPGTLAPGDSLTVLFRADLKPQTAIDESCDPVNNVTVLAAAAEDCAISNPPEYSCEDSSSVALDIGSCGLRVTKDVTCDDPANPGAVLDPDGIAEVLPGATVGFVIRIENTGDTPLIGLNLLDEPDPLGWFVPNSITAEIAGVDVEACVCPGGSPAGVCETIAELNGAKDLAACPIQPGQTLTITFEVRVPANFSSMGTLIDATNTIQVEGFTDACQFAGANPCPMDEDLARINVLVPGVECVKEVCADVNRDGDCTDVGDFPFAADLHLPCDIAFPFNLIYRVITSNTGETALTGIQVCDPALVADAVAAGFTVQPCDLCAQTCDGVGDTCAQPADLPVGSSATTLCRMLVPTRSAWEAFAGGDDDADADCYVNTVGVAVEADTTGLCARGADPVRDTSCDARVCLAPPCEIEVEKIVRCLDGCGDLAGEVGTNALEALPGATIEFEWAVRNMGDTSICALQVDDLLSGPFADCETDPPIFECEIQPATLPPSMCLAEPAGNHAGVPFIFNVQQACGGGLAPGETLICRFRGTVPLTATRDDVVTNGVSVTCAPDDGGGCLATAPVFCGNTADDDALVNVQECALELEKYVTCDEPRLPSGQLNPAAVWQPDLADALPGSVVAFRVEVCNTGDVPLTQLDLEDQLSCPTWFVPDSIAIDIDGVDAEACWCPGGAPAGRCETLAELSGLHHMSLCPILPGECLNITFEVQVPADFDTPGTSLDCENIAAVEPSTDTCGPESPNPCPSDVDTAGINVDVPDLVCVKNVCADLNRDGDCADPGDVPFTNALSLPCDTPAPFDLIYRVSTTNTGETPLANVDLCDPQLIADAAAAGLQFIACELCDDAACQTPGDSCKTVATLAVDASTSALCRIRVPGRAQWEAFANADLDCHVNSSGVTAEVAPAGYCTREADTLVETGCEATACWARPCALTVQEDFRCVDNCTARNPLGAWTSSLDATPGSYAEFQIDCANTGVVGDDPNICALKFTDTTSGSFTLENPNACRVYIVANDGTEQLCMSTNGVPDQLLLQGACGQDLPPGALLRVRCCGQISDTAPSGHIVSNGVKVEAAPVCAGLEPDYCCEGEDEASILVQPCGFTLDKQVTCGDPADPNAPFEPDDRADVLPASTVGFRFSICNNGDAPINAIDLNDQLSCLPWFIPDSITATIGGDNVESCLCPGGTPAGVCETLAELNGHKDLSACPLEAGECLTVTFKVRVPADFANRGTPVDCTNTVTVEGFTELCSDPLNNPCGELTAAAEINVNVPGFECNKEIAADWGPAGSSDAGPGSAIVVPPEAEFPVTLVYTLQIINTGETALVGATVCDGDLVQDALAAGATVGPCDLCTAAPPCDGIGDTCASLGAIPLGGTGTAQCTITFATEAELDAFLDLDGVPDDGAYVNTMTADAAADTNGLCAPASPLDLPVRACSAQLSRTSGHGECYPTTKVTVTIWNENETKFTGTHRCIPFWDQQPLKQYTPAGVPNSFLRENLHTNKGKALLDGLASQHCNAAGFDDSIAAPLVGVAHKELTFNQSATVRGLAGMPLVAVGAEDGILEYTLSSGGISKARSGGTATRQHGKPAGEAALVHASPGFAGTIDPLAALGQPHGSEAPTPIGQFAPPDESSLLTGPTEDGLSFLACMGGPNRAPQPLPPYSAADCLSLFDRDSDGDVDLRDFSRGSTGANMNSRQRTEISSLGSLLVLAKVELRWNAAGELTQDTFLTLNNHASSDVAVQMYFVNGDKPLPANPSTGERAHPGCNWVDVQIALTRDEPTYWSAATGLPKGVSPFTILDPGTPPGRPATDGTTDRVLRGYVVAWAVKPVQVNDRVRYHEISWNFLSGLATVVNYDVTEAWEYEAWPFAALSAPQGEETDARPGSLRLNGVEYEAAPAFLVLDFYSAGSTVFSRPGYEVITQTDLTLLPMIIDLRER